ncbi:hypothetical protein BCR39DRAFT_545047 [Naematelia encephala]|uniref:Zn(2)-C6 fungal-type domain-containing protein n=1 Tax=Naematelia encephala TaxID=71784 RepID=A0A1Y2ARF4_9TREE|nr:hypothetical protein BCR39DRAFT_545047 [Naematelia encephala]
MSQLSNDLETHVLDPLPISSESSRQSGYKLPQRKVKSCGFCYRRKVKCDKTFPCGRCVKRGLGDLCQQETRLVNSDPSLSPSAVSTRVTRRQPTYAELVLENKSLHRKIALQEAVVARLGGSEAASSAHVEEDWKLGSDNESIERDRHVRPRTKMMRGNGESEAVTNDDAAELDVDERELLQTFKEVRNMTHSLGGGSLRPTSIDPTILTTLSLIPSQLSDYLVQFHCDVLHHVHCVFHKPTFLAQYQAWMARRRMGLGMGAWAADKGYDFLAHYFSVIASSMYFAEKPIPGSEGLSQGVVDLLPHFWFDTSINCLHLSGYMGRPTLPVLQTICILPLIASTFGASTYMTMLLHTGLGLARELNFHALTADTPTSDGRGSITRELGRRIWACLRVAECDPATNSPFPLIYRRTPTDIPTNIDDQEMEEGHPIVALPGNHPSDASHLIAMARLAEIYNEFAHDIATHPSPSVRWRIACEYDRRLEHLLDFCPALDPSVDISTGNYPRLGYLEWSRHHWLLTVPVARILMFRGFFGKSFGDDRYEYARKTCVSQARAILTAWMLPRRRLWTRTWHTSTNTVLAGVILATESLRGSHTAETRDGLRAEVKMCINFLLNDADRANTVVSRGVGVLRKLLDKDMEAHPPRHAPHESLVPLVVTAADPTLGPWPSTGLSGTATLAEGLNSQTAEPLPNMSLDLRLFIPNIEEARGSEFWQGGITGVDGVDTGGDDDLWNSFFEETDFI